MKKNMAPVLVAVSCVIIVIVGLLVMSKGKENSNANEPATSGISEIAMRVGDKKYNVKIAGNDAAQEFAVSTPFELSMLELNGNEKYFQGADMLPTKDEYAPGRIEAGDLMLYGDNRIVVFYESFNTNYRYTRLGWIENPEDLRDVLGSDSVDVMFTKD